MKKAPYIEIILLLLVLSTSVRGADYYFSVGAGDDSRSFAEARNPATPWKTINKLNAVFPSLRAGDRILFRRGEVFDGGLVVNQSGSEGRPILLSAYGQGEQPVISGLYTIFGWTARGNGIYESSALPVNGAANMVVINGVNYPMGRYPNTDSENGGYLHYESHSKGLITDKALFPESQWIGAELVLRNARWILDRAPITGQSGHTLYFDAGQLDYGPVDGFGYFIQNDVKTLDQFGEWYFDPKTKRLLVCFGAEPPFDQTVQITAVDILADVRADHITLEHLTLAGANRYGIFADRSRVKKLSIQDCRISFSGIDAIHVAEADNFRLENSFIQYSNNNAVNLSNGCINSRVINNFIYHTGMQAGMGLGGDGNYIAVYNRAKGLVAEFNHILNTGYIALDFSGDSSLVKNNVIDSFCLVKDDGSGIYSYNGDPKKTTHGQKIVGNIVLNGKGAGAGTNATLYLAVEGIYLDDYVNHVEVSGNTVANCNGSGIYIHNARDFTISQNTLFSNQVQLSIRRDDAGATVTGQVFENIFFAKEAIQKAALFSTLDADIASLGLFEDNHYLRPVDDHLTIATEIFNERFFRVRRSYTLEGWQRAYGKDLQSKKSPFAIPDHTSTVQLIENRSGKPEPTGGASETTLSSSMAGNPILFEYNGTREEKVISLDGSYVDARDASYDSRLVLAPFRSIILIRGRGSAAINR